jgi:DNA-directed RNA polymerase specialized sigma subunit, sigma24 homolog
MTEQEFGQVYSRSFDSTVRFLVSRGVHYDAAVDAAQDGWLRGWQRRDQLRDPDALPTWINSIALNIYRTFLRDKESSSVQFHGLHRDQLERRDPKLDTFTWLAAPPVDSAPIDARRTMRLIPPRAQSLLRDFYVEGKSIAELAASYGCSPLAVRIRLLRARQLAKSRVQKKL